MNSIIEEKPWVLEFLCFNQHLVSGNKYALRERIQILLKKKKVLSSLERVLILRYLFYTPYSHRALFESFRVKRESSIEQWNHGGTAGSLGVDAA